MKLSSEKMQKSSNPPCGGHFWTILTGTLDDCFIRCHEESLILQQNKKQRNPLMQNKKSTLWLTQGAIIAAMYVALTIVFVPISYGAIQLRIAEVLTILPMFTSSAIPGLFIGCVLANLLGGAVLLDVVFGSLATLIGAALGWMLRKNRWLVPIPAVLANALIIPFVLRYGYAVDMPLWLMMLTVGAGEVGGCYILGELLASVLLKWRDIFRSK